MIEFKRDNKNPLGYFNPSGNEGGIIDTKIGRL